jgi:HEAT repeat protein
MFIERIEKCQGIAVGIMIFLIFTSLPPNFANAQKNEPSQEVINSYVTQLEAPSAMKTMSQLIDMYFSDDTEKKKLVEQVGYTAFASTNPLVRGQGLSIIGMTRSPQAREIIIEVLQTEKDSGVLHRACSALRDQQLSIEEIPHLLDLSKELDQRAGTLQEFGIPRLQASLLSSIAHAGGEESFPLIRDFLNEDPATSVSLSDQKPIIFAATGNLEAIRILFSQLKDESFKYKGGRVSRTIVISGALSRRMEEEDPPDQETLVLAWESVDLFTTMASDEKEHPELRMAACQALAKLGTANKKFALQILPTLEKLRPFWKTHRHADLIEQYIEKMGQP